MKYLLLIYGDEGQNQDVSPEAMGRWRKVTEDMTAAGVLLGGEALQPVATATTVRAPGGKVVTTDGPFAETKEQLGGFYFIDVEHLDDALRWAAALPASEHGSIEVRPVMSFD